MAEVSSFRKEFGLRIKALRKQKGWAMKELAAKLAVQTQHLNKYESGLHAPPLEKIIELSELFDVTVDYLLSGNQSTPRPLHHLRLWERFHTLESMDHEDQDLAIKVIDALIMQTQAEKLARERDSKKKRARG